MMWHKYLRVYINACIDVSDDVSDENNKKKLDYTVF